MKTIAVIPARYASTRFPGKLLAKETGKYLIQHVYEQVSRAGNIESVLIATDDRRIGEACDEFGAKWCMTRADHPSGTDRIAETAAGLEADIIINVQGDEPEIEPANLETLAGLLKKHSFADMATLAAPFGKNEDVSNPNVVKVVLNNWGSALYFSRSIIPYQRDARSDKPVYYKHLGTYAYRREMLHQISQLKPTPLEQAEKLEQLRVLEYGYAIAVGIVDHAVAGIDTPEQYKAFVERYNNR